MKSRNSAVSQRVRIDHRANRFLAALEPDDYACLEPYLESVSLAAGAVLYEAGDTISHVYFPHDSIVSLVSVMQDGGSAEMAVFGCELMAGLITAIVTRRSPGRYIVQFSGTASRIETERLVHAIRARPGLQQLFYRAAEALMSRIFQNAACNAVHSVEERCCRWILSVHDRLDRDTMPLTHEFLAEMLGVQRSTVSIITRTLQVEGLIRQGRGNITVTDRAGLERASCECYRTVRGNFERLLPYTYTKADQRQ